MNQERQFFGTDGIRGIANIHPMTAETALLLGRAITAYHRDRGNRAHIVIAKDTRRSGYMLENALTAGITSMGGKAFLLGPLPTPSVAYHIRGLRAQGGVMISASHNPFEDNGLKVFNEDGFKLSDEAELEIEKWMLAAQKNPPKMPAPDEIGTAKRIDDAQGRYLVHLKSIFSRHFDLAGMKIVYDGANGAAYDCGRRLLQELGAEVVTMACEPNGLNINKNCAQENPSLLGQRVLAEKAELGIGVDGDADRVLIVDETGHEISGEHFMFEMALYLRDLGRLKAGAIVTTAMANQALIEALEEQKIRTLRSAVGDRYVLAEMQNHGVIFGGETSGHYIFLDQNTTADALFSGLEVLALLQSRKWKASRLRESFQLFPQRLVSIPVKVRKPLDACENLQKSISQIELRYQGKGRVNVRYSGTQLMLRIMMEGPDLSQIEKDIEEVTQVALKELG
ncbi:MAG: phosphoglucosamine mutase [Bdellovibrionota bacterium]